MRKKTSFWYFLLILILGITCFAISFPDIFNAGVNFLNLSFFQKIGFSLPHAPAIPFRLGLDLQGGTHLVYEADLSNIPPKEQKESMAGLRDVIERRVNFFGVTEPIVRTEQKGSHQRLIVELPGVKDVSQAIEMIGKTPFLEFREERPESETQEILKAQKEGERLNEDPYFKPTKLTGRFLKKATLGFNQNTLEPEVLLEFTKEGKEIFRDLTKKNVGKRLAIYIDNILISAPVVREEISGGKAQITGKFTLEEAKSLVRNLNAGALPVPIHLVSQTTVGPALGKISLQESLKSAVYGFLAVSLFMILIYRMGGVLAVFSLCLYGVILLTLFKIIPVTLTLAGIGGAILSMGMAVDANVLIFERQKEERKRGMDFSRALVIGFQRAWPSIRDGNFTTLLIALIMFSFGTSFVKGFALTLSLGILVSLFCAMFVVRVMQSLFVGTVFEKMRFMW